MAVKRGFYKRRLFGKQQKRRKKSHRLSKLVFQCTRELISPRRKNEFIKHLLLGDQDQYILQKFMTGREDFSMIRVQEDRRVECR